MVYKAKDIEDAHKIRDVLAQIGITAHLAEPATETDTLALGFIRVSVDNERLDAARRAIAASYRDRKMQHF
jgi:hypothetical protein